MRPQSTLLTRVLAVKEQHGLLLKFIEYRLRTYQEPTRKGTAHGEAVGFSRTKYLASLLALTKHSVKETAAMVQVSYGVLRKWRTEDSFHQAVHQHHEDFVSEVLLPYLFQMWEEGRFFAVEQDLPNTRSEVPNPHTIYSRLLARAPELSDLAYHSSNCCQVLMEHLFKDTDHQRGKELMNLITLLYVSARNEKIRNKRQDALFWSKWYVGAAIQMLEHGTPTKETLLQQLELAQRFLVLSDWPEVPA